MSALTKYEALMLQLEFVRWRNAGDESQEEDHLLDKMDEVWDAMGQDEREAAERVPYPVAFRNLEQRGVLVLVDTSPRLERTGQPRRLQEAA